MRRTPVVVLVLLVALLAAWYFLTRQRTLPLPPEAALTGWVTDGNGPVAGARVRFQGDADSVLTDADGRFRLPLKPETVARVTASKDGYFIAGAGAADDPLVLTLHRLPAEDCEDYAWVSP